MARVICALQQRTATKQGGNHDVADHSRQTKAGNLGLIERANKEAVAKAGKIPGLKGRWLAHADDDPDAGYTISLWENDAAMRAYENGEVLQNTILPRLKPFFSGDYTTTRCEVRFAEEFD